MDKGQKNLAVPEEEKTLAVLSRKENIGYKITFDTVYLLICCAKFRFVQKRTNPTLIKTIEKSVERKTEVH